MLYRLIIVIFVVTTSSCSTLRASLGDDQYEKECDQGNAKSCQCAAWDALNKSYKPGPMQPDSYLPSSEERNDLAESFLQKGCKLGDQMACKNAFSLCVDDRMSPQERCVRGEKSSCKGANKQANLQQEQSGSNLWEGSKSNRVINIQTEPRYMYFQYYGLSQLVDGYAMFQWAGPAELGLSGPIIAIKQAGFKGVNLTPGTCPAKVVNCIKYTGDQDWKNDLGFPMKVKTYQVSKCPEKG